jgi:hypothetical protein
MVEVRRLGVRRTYNQRRAHPRRTDPRYEYQLAPCRGPEQDCAGCAAGDMARFGFDGAGHQALARVKPGSCGEREVRLRAPHTGPQPTDRSHVPCGAFSSRYRRPT